MTATGRACWLAACAGTLVLAAPMVAQSAAVDLERKGEGYPVYRIPALAVTTKGTLLAAYDGRPTMADVPSQIALLLRRSRDGGRSWSERQVVRADSAPLGYGDPSFVVDEVTGRIFLFHVASVRQGFFGSATGTREDDPDVLQADVGISDDDGLTWRFRRITSAIKSPAWGGLFAASGAGIQLRHGPHRGRLLQQFVVRVDGAIYAATAWSDDHGERWQMGPLVGPGMDENKSVELSDGRVLLNSRARGIRRVARSSDGGVTYGPVHDDSTLVDPGNNAAIVRVHPTAPVGSAAARQLLFSHTAHPTERRNLTLRLSCDDGATWPHALVIEAGPAAYSTLAMLDDRTVGILYERGSYEAITFRRVDVGPLVVQCGVNGER